MVKHLLAIAFLVVSAISASGQSATVLKDGEPAPNCKSGKWGTAEKITPAEMQKIFGPSAACPVNMSPYRLRCADESKQWKVRCEPDSK